MGHQDALVARIVGKNFNGGKWMETRIVASSLISTGQRQQFTCKLEFCLFWGL